MRVTVEYQDDELSFCRRVLLQVRPLQFVCLSYVSHFAVLLSSEDRLLTFILH